MKIPGINVPVKKILVKPKWAQYKENDTRQFFEPFKVNHEKLGNLDVSIRKYEDGFSNWIIEVKNALDQRLGKEVLYFEKDTKNLTGLNIIVEPEYRHSRFKNYKLGELLRLSSLMEMIQNKSSHIKIYSKGSAVYFHSKYGFEPDITIFADRNRSLESIIANSDNNTYDFVEKAQDIMAKVRFYKDDAPVQRELCRQTNSLLKEYIQEVLKLGNSDENYPFNIGMNMILRKDTIEKNRSFYNKLFEKQGIDFTI